ncbi:MAG: hypothetical protein HUU20_12535 [Pirellulales bacterium]|nr:hypothetical protein [Pirellulales bacterium]
MSYTGRTTLARHSLLSPIVAGLCCLPAPAAGLAAPAGRGMAIESATEDQHAIRVVTNAAEFVFHKADRRISLSQRIPVRRSLGSISGLPLDAIRLIRSTDRECEISGGPAAASVKLSSDGLVRICLPGPVEVTVQGAYEPRYRQHLAHDFFLPDEQGGLAIYLISGEAREELPASWKAGWPVRYLLSKPGELWVAAFPPKPFDWSQSRETMLHSFSCKHPYPSDDDLRAWRRFGSVLTLHSWVWKGTTGSQYGVEHDNSYESPDFEPKSADEFRRVVRTAHALDMKVIPYMSPYYAAKPTPAGIDKFVATVEKRKQELGFDGVYFDGAFASIASAYEVVLRTRRVIGDDGILHMHLTGVPDMICPFIDCHADYLLRGEHGSLDQDYARWYVSCYNLGNAIGTFCYDRLRVSSGMIDRIFSVNARLPFWVDDGTWNGAKYHLTEPEQQLMIREYYPRLQQQQEPSSRKSQSCD